MFEQYRSPALFVSKDAVLECYSVGKTTGLVIDIGGAGTTLTPVLDGWAEVKGINKTVIGGRYMDSHLLNIMKRRQMQAANFSSSSSSSSSSAPFTMSPQFRVAKTVVGDRITNVSVIDVKNVHPTYDAYMNLEVTREIKEFACRMADTVVNEFDPRFCNLPVQQYELPDGSIVDIGVERFLVPEILCDWSPVDIYQADVAALGLAPDASSDSSPSVKSIPRLALDSILKCDMDCHTSLLSSLVVAGGGSSIEGIPDRMRSEVEQLVHSSAPNAWKVKMTAAGNNERALSCWIGGSILGSLGSFHEMWMTKAEYAEYGSSLIDKKCP
jgi:actin-like protein 6A